MCGAMLIYYLRTPHADAAQALQELIAATGRAAATNKLKHDSLYASHPIVGSTLQNLVVREQGTLRDGAPDAAYFGLCKPEVVVRSAHDHVRPAVHGRDSILVDHPVRCDTPDLVGAVLDEPQSAVRAERDTVRTARGARYGILTNEPSRGYPRNLAGVLLREPQRTVRSAHDHHRDTPGGGQRKLGHDPTGGDAPDLMCGLLCEPQRPI